MKIIKPAAHTKQIMGVELGDGFFSEYFLNYETIKNLDQILTRVSILSVLNAKNYVMNLSKIMVSYQIGVYYKEGMLCSDNQPMNAFTLYFQYKKYMALSSIRQTF